MTIIPAKRVNPSATRITPITPECAGRDGTPEHRPPPMPGRSTVGTRVIPMSRKVCGVMTGWLAAASVAVAQTGGTTGIRRRPKARLFRHIMQRRAPWIGRMKPAGECCRRCRQRRLSRRPQPRSPTGSAGGRRHSRRRRRGHVAGDRTAASCGRSGWSGYACRQAGTVPAAPAGSCPSCGTAPTCNCNVQQQTGPCGPAGQFWGDAELLLWWTRGMNVPPLSHREPGRHASQPGRCHRHSWHPRPVWRRTGR